MRWLFLIIMLMTMIHVQPSFAAEKQCFPTGYCIEGRLLEYWQQNGGLPVFGYPIGEAKVEYNRDLNAQFMTQWFERARLELHPENQAPYDVLLGRLGDDRLRYTNIIWRDEPSGDAPKAGCLWFAETRHNVCDQANGLGFKTYWQTHGLNDPKLDQYARSLQLFGLPLTEPRMETNTSGDTVLTQWFERARFEWHPNKPNEYKVLLGLLGNEMANAPHTADSYPETLTMFQNSVIFSADDGVHGRELWRSDGTTTVMLKDIWAGGEFSTPIRMTNINDSFVLFDANDGVHGWELWRTDGTGVGTYLLKDINAGSNSGDPFQIINFNGTALFMADDGVHGLELWRSDGTPAGTFMVKDINAGSKGVYPSVNYPMGAIMFQLTQIGNVVYFFADDGVHGTELWKTDGTQAGTQLVVDLAAGDKSMSFDQLVKTERYGLVFSAWDEINGDALWRTDGTAAGTIKLGSFTRVRTGIRSYSPIGNIVEWNAKLYVTIYDGAYQLRQSDGTVAGTYRATTFESNLDWQGGSIFNFNGVLYYQPFNQRYLRRASNESDITNVAIPNQNTIHVAGGRMYIFDTMIEDNVTRMYASNGAGTEFRQIATFISTITASIQTVVGDTNHIFMSVADDAHGIELWSGDANTLGLTLAKDINTLPR